MDHIYGLTVQGIQSYIFATNNLREIIGGSELIESLCTEKFDSFIDRNNIKGQTLLQAAGNIRFQTDENSAAKIYEEFQIELLQHAPGVPFSQAVIKINKLSEAIGEIDAALRAQRNQPQFAFDLNNMGRMLSRTTGDAAVDIRSAKTDYPKQKRKSLDKVNFVKFNLGGKPVLIKQKLQRDDLKFAKNFDQIAKGARHSWLALVHIDGNGMGKIIQKIIANSDGNVFKRLKAFSGGVEKATINAFKDALKSVEFKNSANNVLPFRPLVLGGDDITAIMRADLALNFCETYLKKFEDYTKANLSGFEECDNGLTACAGIAYVKEKFPFHYSAELAEELCSFAKNNSGREKSCLMFHRVQDSFISEYKEIISRELSTIGDGSLINGPYYIHKESGKETIVGLSDEVKQLRKEDSPKNAMREWLDLALSGSDLTKTLEKRMEGKYKGTYANLWNKKRAYNDLLTQLAVSE